MFRMDLIKGNPIFKARIQEVKEESKTPKVFSVIRFLYFKNTLFCSEQVQTEARKVENTTRIVFANLQLGFQLPVPIMCN